MWKKLWGVFCCWGMVTGGMAQDVVPVRALSSPEIINPAYYNREAGVSAALWYRHQWGKLEKSPQYMGVSVHKLWSPGKWGTGVNGGYSKSGYRKDYQFGLTGDRGFALSENSRLSLGLTAGMQLVRYDWPENLGNAGTGIKPEDFNKEWFYVAGGVAWNYRELSLGAGYRGVFRDGDDGTYSRISLYGEYRIGLGSRWDILPRALYVYDSDWDSDLDLGVFAYYRNMAGIGLIWRKEQAIGVQGEMRLLDCLAVTYCYEPSTGTDANVFGASHEVSLKFNSGGLYKKK